MQKLGYSDAKPLPIKIQTRNLPTYRDPAVIVTDQLKKIYIVGELDILDTPRWYAKLAKDYTIGLNVTGVCVDDPDGNIVENYSCNSERNYTQYCNAEVDKLLVAQSRELDKEKRNKMVWDIERILVEDAARPASCRRRRQLLAALCEKLQAARQQPVQQLALRGRVAGQVIRSLRVGGAKRASACRNKCGTSGRIALEIATHVAPQDDETAVPATGSATGRGGRPARP